MPSFVQELNEMVQAEANSLRNAIRYSFPVLFSLDDCFAKLAEQIVKPAVDLAMLIQTQPVRYKYTPQLDFPPLQLKPVMFPTVLDHATVRDIETRKKLTLHSNIIMDRNGCVGDKIMITEPGLVRCGPNMQTEVVIRKPQVVVYLKRPLGKRQR